MKFAERMRLFLLFSRKRSPNAESIHQKTGGCYCGHNKRCKCKPAKESR